ncbi:uncharacterized protein LOC113005286 [Solenopsis invicta]|uniref:uncharacterized protein LOC113005286 n=1 Tax=Solenopsis invicta TaxID=13686 RepID=UPI00193D3DB4|nr:uncharacterized protein LOC113005286 [Solenopsis invicta]
MPKPQYEQKFRNTWLHDPLFKDWLIAVNSTNGVVGKCNACNRIMTSRYATLKDHGNSKYHKKNLNIILGPKANPKIPFVRLDTLDATKEAEGKLCLFIAAHTSIRTIDHLNDIYKISFSGINSADYLQLHRTKCSNIIKNVIGPYFIEKLREDIGSSSYSLIIDESTDISVQKYLGIVIIYYSENANKIIYTFLDLVPLISCDADSLVDCIKATLRKFKLNLHKLMGLGTDNAFVMIGVNNGVFQKLKSEVPHLILIKCLCHSLQLGVSAATKECLPRNLEFIIQETYNWFSHSTLRQAAYKEIYQTLNDNQNPLKIVQACQTRWLSIESAVSRIYTQWESLKCHFNISRQRDKCYMAELLYQNYNDNINYAYLCFLKPILVELQMVNKLFESNDVDPTKLLKDLKLLLDTFVKIIVPPGRKLNVFSDSINNYVDRSCYLGYLFETKVTEMKNSGFSKKAERELRDRCINFLLKLIEQIQIRLPDNYEVLQHISSISVEEALKRNKRKLTDILIEFKKPAEFIDIIERQWQKIQLLHWNEIKDTKKFWYEVNRYTDAGDNKPFKELANFAMELLVLPHSNAEVERLFSAMNITKTKLRNKMQLPMLTAILAIRSGLKRVNKCCKTFDLPNDVVKKIKTNECYVPNNPTDDDNIDFDFDF